MELIVKILSVFLQQMYNVCFPSKAMDSCFLYEKEILSNKNHYSPHRMLNLNINRFLNFQRLNHILNLLGESYKPCVFQNMAWNHLGVILSIQWGKL